MKTTFAIAALLANASAINLRHRFVSGLSDEEIITSNAQVDRTTVVDTHWVELPNCSGKTGEVQLATDLHNASKATCKNGTALDLSDKPSSRV
jgi:hypothetical protein